MVKPGKGGRGGLSGGRGCHHNPPQATRSESTDLISKQESEIQEDSHTLPNFERFFDKIHKKTANEYKMINFTLTI